MTPAPVPPAWAARPQPHQWGVSGTIWDSKRSCPGRLLHHVPLLQSIQDPRQHLHRLVPPAMLCQKGPEKLPFRATLERKQVCDTGKCHAGRKPQGFYPGQLQVLDAREGGGMGTHGVPCCMCAMVGVVLPDQEGVSHPAACARCPVPGAAPCSAVDSQGGPSAAQALASQPCLSVGSECAAGRIC